MIMVSGLYLKIIKPESSERERERYMSIDRHL